MVSDGVVEADFEVLARLPEINGGAEDAALFIHAVLARLRDPEAASGSPAYFDLESPEGRGAYESHFQEVVVRHVLEPGPDGLSAMGRLRREASGPQEGLKTLPTSSLLVRAGIPDEAWGSGVAPCICAAMLPHLLRPLLDPEPRL